MQQVFLTPASGKKLISTALAAHPDIQNCSQNATLVIIAGTTNGYLAELLLARLGESQLINRRRFFRGITLPPGYKVSDTGRLKDESAFPGDVIIQKGKWLKGKTINEIASDLKEGDLILKGANALDLDHRRAAILVGNPSGGTVMPILQSVIGRRIRLMVPVGLEKRVSGDLEQLAVKINQPGVRGFRFMPIPGEVFTEIEALHLLCGVDSQLFAAGGISGAEGGIWLTISGSAAQEEAAMKLCESIAAEPGLKL
jgi:hypothetical protein